jgi:hypothetical protein
MRRAAGRGIVALEFDCLLVEDAAPRRVLRRLANLRRDTKRAHRTSPETQSQGTFVEHGSS